MSVPAVDAYNNRYLVNLYAKHRWAQTFGYKLFDGEWGRPYDQVEFRDFQRKYMGYCRANDIWITPWTMWPNVNPLNNGDELTVYYFTGSGYATGTGQVTDTGLVQEEFPVITGGTPWYGGINFNSGSNGFPVGGQANNGMSNLNPGVHGTGYFYGNANMWNYIASRIPGGLIRFGVRLERIAPILSGALDDQDMDLIETQLDLMNAAGLKCLPVLNNYGRYRLEAVPGTITTEVIGDSATYTRAVFQDVVEKLIERLWPKAAVIGLGTMGEPGGMTQTSWNTTVQGFLTAGRNKETALGQPHKLMAIMPHPFFNEDMWRDFPTGITGWTDPNANFRIETHPYAWGDDGTGAYERLYHEYLTESRTLGWEPPGRNTLIRSGRVQGRPGRGIPWVWNFVKNGTALGKGATSGWTAYSSPILTKVATGLEIKTAAGGGTVGILLGPLIAGNNIYLDADVACTGGGEIQIIFRFKDFSNYMYARIIDDGSVTLVSVRAGSFVTLQNAAGYFENEGQWRQAMHRLSIEADGPVIRVYVNGILVLTGTETVNLANVPAHIRVQVNKSGSEGKGVIGRIAVVSR